MHACVWSRMSCDHHLLHLAWSASLPARVHAPPLLLHDRTHAAAPIAYLATAADPGYIDAVWLDAIGTHRQHFPTIAHPSSSSFFSAPLAYDCDADGEDDILLLDAAGALRCLRPSGSAVADERGPWHFQLPRLSLSRRGADAAAPNLLSDAELRAPPNAAGDRAPTPRRRYTAEALASFSLFGSSPMGVADTSAAEGAWEGVRGGGSAQGAGADGILASDGGDAADGRLWLDPHVFSSGTIADVDNDGELELLVSVSYYRDGASESNPANRSEPIACSLVCVGLGRRAVRWSTLLNATLDGERLRALADTSPSVSDLDGDGELEVGVGTSTGSVYVLRARDGAVRPGWPAQMDDAVRTQPGMADIDGDGALELVAADSSGLVSAWRHDGSRLWVSRVHGAPAPGVAFAHVGGAARLIVTTVAGWIHVLDGATGEQPPPFPLKTGGQIRAPALALGLLPRSDANEVQPHIVVSSFDGLLYIVNAMSGCLQTADIGEHAHARVLSDDLTGNGRMDLLVATTEGNLLCIETSTPHAPTRAWLPDSQGRNVAQMREGWVSIQVVGRRGRRGVPRVVMGESFDLDVVIRDARALRAPRYQLEVRMGRRPPLLAVNLSSSGSMRLRIPCPRHRARGELTVSMLTDRGQYFEDTVLVSFNEEVVATLKWLVLLPFTAVVALVVATTSLAAPFVAAARTSKLQASLPD